MLRAAIIVLTLALCANAFAQSIGGMSGIGFRIGGAGGGGGGGASGCANQLVLDYSNSCALIGQAWGQ